MHVIEIGSACRADAMMQDSKLHTLGGRWADRRVFVRRKMNALTICDNSADRSAARASFSGATPGSRPSRIGRSKRLRKVAGVPSTPGLQKLTIA